MQVLLRAVTLIFCCCIWLLVPVTVGYNPGQPAEKRAEKKNPGINPGQGPKKKKNLVLTMGSLPEKGEK